MATPRRIPVQVVVRCLGRVVTARRNGRSFTTSPLTRSRNMASTRAICGLSTRQHFVRLYLDGQTQIDGCILFRTLASHTSPPEQEGPSSLPPSPEPTTWVDRILPGPLQPYAHLARMDKPIGTALLLWPCFWSTALAAPPGYPPDPKLLALFGVGAFVMRGAGCTINDLWDAEFDKEVERTRTRPLASGALTKKQAIAFLAAQLSAGLGVLVSLPHTWYCFKLGAASLPLVVCYPLMKRYTNWPQLVLGMTFNWGALMGWVANHGALDLNTVLPLYLSGVSWTLVYDTLYAHQDKRDDAKLGLKSTALYFGQNTKPILHGFAMCSLAGWNAAGWAVGYTSPLFYAGTAAAYAHLFWQIHTADLDEPSNLAHRFRTNNAVGAIVFCSIVAGNITMAA